MNEINNAVNIEMINLQSKQDTLFRFTPEQFGAPTDGGDGLFMWQSNDELEIAKKLESFGGVEGIAQSLGTDLTDGLTDEQAKDPERLRIYGTNKQEEAKGITYCGLLYEGVQEFTLIILLISSVISVVTGIIAEGPKDGWIEGFAIFVAVFIILNIEAINDLQKDKQFRELNAINNKKTIKVVRNDAIQELSTDDIVVGDILNITCGDTMPCDILYLNGTNVVIDESKLTGEPDEIKKNNKKPFIVSSSECHNGSFNGLVINVGNNSVYGKMKLLIQSSNDDDNETSLQLKLKNITTIITYCAAIVGVLIVVVMIIRHVVEHFQGKGTIDKNGKIIWNSTDWNSIVSFFITGITILVVAIPVGLPLAVTIALAYSVKKMMKDNNLVRHLSACVTMGSANTICSDKTGTLTLGQMTVMQGWVFDEDNKDESECLNEYIKLNTEERNNFINKYKNLEINLRNLIVENCCLNNDAFLIYEDDKFIRGNGSSLDIALLKFVNELGEEYNYTTVRNKFPKVNTLKKEEILDYEKLGQSYVVKSYPFNSNRKRSSIILKTSYGYRVYVKGAAEIIVRLCNNAISDVNNLKKMTGYFKEDNDGNLIGDGSRYRLVKHCVSPMAMIGLRVIALAYRDIKTEDNINIDDTIIYKSEDEKGVGECPIVEDDLTLIGLIGVQDPPRPEVPDAVLDCQKAGIFVRMVTGDNIETAKAIATQVNIYYKDGYKDGQGRQYPPGKCLTGAKFRELVGGLVLPPHFKHRCNCKDYSEDPSFKVDYKTPDFPIHFGYPSIVGHNSKQCEYWKTNSAGINNNNDEFGDNIPCNKECKERGCFKLLRNKNSQSEYKKYEIIKNQYIFDTLVESLQVMGRSAPSDKHMLVSGLMERKLIVAVTGDGTNDGPALSKSNVGFAMGIAGTSVAKEASDIILMDDNFSSIVKAVMWGRNVYDNIRKFLQFQLTINAVAVTLTFISACVIKESPIQPIQMLWIDLVMDTFAALSFASEVPHKQLLNKPPYDQNEPIITKTMFRNIIGHFFYQIIIVLVLTVIGYEIMDVPNGSHLGPGTKATKHLTYVFNTFVMLQCFNEVNSRKINNELNVFSYINTNKPFLIIMFFIIVIQILFVTFGGNVLNSARLNVLDHVVCILLGFVELIIYQLIRLIPSDWFIDVGSDQSVIPQLHLNILQRTHSRARQTRLPSVSNNKTKTNKPKTLNRIFSA